MTSDGDVEPGRPARLGLALLMVGAGVTHFLVPRFYEPVVPRWAGDPRRVVLVSGAAELACGSLLLSRMVGCPDREPTRS